MAFHQKNGFLNMNNFLLSCVIFILFSPNTFPQNTATILGNVREKNNEKIQNIIVLLKNTKFQTYTTEDGAFELLNVPYGTYFIVAFSPNTKTHEAQIIVDKDIIQFDIILEQFDNNLELLIITSKREETFGITRLKSVENFGIYEGKKTEVVVLKDLTANLATNNARQVYAKIVGLNIWESDGAGLQLGIGGRGLSPDRTSNFNVRQNGYDISADALGYPEAYYTPPNEATDRIEIVRGAASLQYGTQFGGMVNFVMKKGEANQKINFISRQSLGSWGFWGSFNSLSGEVGRLNYYVSHQYKKGDGYRDNSRFSSQNIFASLAYKFSNKLKVNLDITKMNYLTQQAGGLTDKMFQENDRQSIRKRNFFEVDWSLFSLNGTYKFTDRTQINVRNFALFASRKSVGNLERITRIDLGGERTLISGNFKNWGSEVRLLHRYQFLKKPNVLLIGTRLYMGNTSAKQGNGSNGNDANFNYLNPENLENSDYSFPNKNYAVFIENIFNITSKLSFTAGIRGENIQTYSEGYYKTNVFDGAGNLIVSNKKTENQVKERNIILLGAGMSYKMTTKVEFYANVSQNYRAINFTDLRIVNPVFFVDANIKDEKGFTADAGVRGSVEGFFTYEATAFMLFYQGRIGQILKAGEAPLYNDYRLRTNIADSRNVGIELFGELSLLKLFQKNLPTNKQLDLSIFVNFSVIDARYINTEDASIRNKKVEMAPPFALKTGGTLKYKKMNVSLQFSYIEKHFSDASNATRTASAVEGLIPSYKVLDFSINYTWKVLKIEASINNILDKRYFTRRAEFYPGPGIIPSDGRGFYVTLQVKIGSKERF